MSHAAYPVALDLSGFLLTAGMLKNPPTAVQQFLDVESANQAAIDEWAELTRYRPFLGDAADVSRKFDPPEGYILDLHAGLLSFTSLTVGVTSTSAGTALTKDQDFFLGPPNRDIEGRPWEMIEFYRAFRGPIRSFVVVGKWGREAMLSDLTFNSIIKGGAARVAAQFAAARSQGLLLRREGDVTEEYGGRGLTPWSAEEKMWRADFERGVGQRRRPITI